MYTRIAESFHGGLETGADLDIHPKTRLATFIDSKGSPSSLDYWAVSRDVTISEVTTGPFTSAQHRPLSANVELPYTDG
jgi:hypothetical protein